MSKKTKPTPKHSPTAPRISARDAKGANEVARARLEAIRGSVERNSAHLPREVMSGVSWSFRGGRDRDLAAFVERVTEYNDELGDRSWNPTQLVIRAPVIRVAHGDDQAKTLRSISPGGFTMADVLHQIHNHYRELAEADHAFFEGLELEDEGPPPLYHVRLGS